MDPEGLHERGEVLPPMAQMSWQGGFLLTGEADLPLSVNTGVAPWAVVDLTDAVKLSRPSIGGYHDIGPEFEFDVRRWFETKGSVPAKVVVAPVPINIYGLRRPGWSLYPASLPEQSRSLWSGGRARAVRNSWNEGPVRSEELSAGELIAVQSVCDGGRIEIASHSEWTWLWDLETYLCGYPWIQTAGGEGALLEVAWAEALFEELEPRFVTDASAKGNRGDILGKVFSGVADRWQLGAAPVQEVPALWWRCGRYVRIRIRTAGEPLQLLRLAIKRTEYPLGPAAAWRSSDPGWDHLMRIFHCSFRNSAHEMWTDSPYYEQMCYVGDNALTVLTNYALFQDDRLSRRSLTLYDWSRRGSGLVAERYPSEWRQESGTYSLIWPLMIRDYAWWRGEPEFVATLIPGLRSVLAEFDGLAGANGLLGRVPGWPFVDWVSDPWSVGCGPGMREGDSSIINLQWVLALLAGAQVEEAFGDALIARSFHFKAGQVLQRVIERYWDEKRGLLLDTVGCEAASEHAQAFALMTGLLDATQSAACLNALRSNSELAKASIYGTFYVLEALHKNGDSGEFHRRLEPWRDLLEDGLMATPEQFGRSRTDCHAWGAHPAWHSHASIAGIRPAAPSFSKVRIAPCPGRFREIHCEVHHPGGLITVAFDFADAAVTGAIQLPEGVTGEFHWHGTTTALPSGRIALSL
jgi:hypothetical protein